MYFAFFLPFYLVRSHAKIESFRVQCIEFKALTQLASEFTNSYHVPRNDRIADTSDIMNSQDVDSLLGQCD